MSEEVESVVVCVFYSFVGNGFMELLWKEFVVGDNFGDGESSESVVL